MGVTIVHSYMSDTYAISRIDLPLMKTHGWQVRLRRQGKLFSKFFSDRKHGGVDSAFLIARSYRNELIKKLPDPVRAGAEGKLTRRNVSGVVGVSRIVIKMLRAGDILDIQKDKSQITVEVLDVLKKRVSAKEAINYKREISIITEDRVDPLVKPVRGEGRPTKRQRRVMDAFLDQAEKSSRV